MRRAALFLAGLMLALTPTVAHAHEERASQFPPGNGHTPTYRTAAQAADVLVVCKPDTASLVARIADPALRARNEQLLKRCGFAHLQAAVDAVRVRRTNIYVLPGHYREEPSLSAPCTKSYAGGIVTYEQVVSCGEIVDLVTIAGDSVTDPDIVCDNQLCDLQIEGTGAAPTDVLFTAGFRADGDWAKHNVLKADRADGIYLKNMGFELAKENAVYVHETDGYVIDNVVARNNDLYGILTFTSDHGLIKNCETHHNGDSGIYPGSAADVNAASTQPPPLTRWSVEITGCNTHHNALGFSGTAGNSVYFHDNRVHDNGAGYVTDSFVGGHPGMPQDHAWLEDNDIYSNNTNYYGNVQGSSPPCSRRPAAVGYEKGMVCPSFQVPVGTGILIAGGNYNLIRNNRIYDNWRNGAMLFWVPGAIRGDMTASGQLDTSNHNRYIGNRLGFHPAGVTQPNGTDFWWDDQGLGNCWEGNVAATGQVTTNAVVPVLPTCAVGSILPAGSGAKSATLLPCSMYNRNSEPGPPGCDWLDSPAPPPGRQAAPGEPIVAAAAVTAPTQSTGGDALPATGGTPPVLLAGVVLVAGLLVYRRVRRPVDPSR